MDEIHSRRDWPRLRWYRRMCWAGVTQACCPRATSPSGSASVSSGTASICLLNGYRLAPGQARATRPSPRSASAVRIDGVSYDARALDPEQPIAPTQPQVDLGPLLRATAPVFVVWLARRHLINDQALPRSAERRVGHQRPLPSATKQLLQEAAVTHQGPWRLDLALAVIRLTALSPSACNAPRCSSLQDATDRTRTNAWVHFRIEDSEEA